MSDVRPDNRLKQLLVQSAEPPLIPERCRQLNPLKVLCELPGLQLCLPFNYVGHLDGCLDSSADVRWTLQTAFEDTRSPGGKAALAKRLTSCSKIFCQCRRVQPNLTRCFRDACKKLQAQVPRPVDHLAEAWFAESWKPITGYHMLSVFPSQIVRFLHNERAVTR